MLDPIKSYNPMTLSDFQAKYPLIDWTGILEFVIPQGAGIKSPNTVIVRTPEYYERLNDLLAKNVTLKTLQEYFIIQLVISKVYALDENSRAAYREMNGNISSGTSAKQPRWRTCVNNASNVYGNTLGRFFTLRQFGSEKERKQAEAFLDTIYEAWLNRLPQVEWLDEQTRAKAIEKVFSKA